MTIKPADKPASLTPLASTGAPSFVVFLRLAPLTLAVFIAFLTIGLQLPVLPLHLKDALGMNATMVGVVVGAQFAAALLSRAWAGNQADLHGAKRAVVMGFMAAAVSALIYLASLALLDRPALSVLVLLAGRVVLALGESLVVTGAMSWGWPCPVSDSASSRRSSRCCSPRVAGATLRWPLPASAWPSSSPACCLRICLIVSVAPGWHWSAC
ncbi:arabinose transporter [Herbaspirillum sp. BH-1]|nr:arabinose transporter [Herbaspirillum sp. BH-1]